MSFYSALGPIVKIFTIALMLVLLESCSFNESKIKSIAEREVGAELVIEKAKLELDKQLGRGDSKLKSSLLENMSKRINIEYTEIIVEGRRARISINAEVPRLKDIGALFAEARTLSRDKILDLTADEFLREVNRLSRKPASENEFKNEQYQFYIDFEKNKEWVANSEQLKKAYNKKNLVH